MDLEKMKRYSRLGDTGQDACADRLRAAIFVTGLKQKEIAEAISKGVASVSNQVKARQYPSRALASFLYERYRIDFNFLFSGHFAQLPGDVQESLYTAFEEIHTGSK